MADTNEEHRSGRVPTLEEIKRWPVTVDVPTAGTAFGIKRSQSYELAARGEFPAKVIPVGRRGCRVVTASIIQVLSADEAE